MGAQQSSLAAIRDLPRNRWGLLVPTYEAVRPDKLFSQLYYVVKNPISAELVSEIHTAQDRTAWFIIIHTKVCVHVIEVVWGECNSFSNEQIVRKVFAGFVMRHWGVSRGIEPFVRAGNAWWWRCKHYGLHYGEPGTYVESYKNQDLVYLCKGLICVCDDTERRNLSWRIEAAVILLGIRRFRRTILNTVALGDAVRIIAQFISRI